MTPRIDFFYTTRTHVVAECTLCGPMGVYAAVEMYRYFIAHLAVEHKVGVTL